MRWTFASALARRFERDSPDGLLVPYPLGYVKNARLANSSGVSLAIELQLAEKKKQLLYGKKKMYISQHYFGQHEGHLRDEANDIAKESGAWHVN